MISRSYDSKLFLSNLKKQILCVIAMLMDVKRTTYMFENDMLFWIANFDEVNAPLRTIKFVTLQAHILVEEYLILALLCSSTKFIFVFLLFEHLMMLFRRCYSAIR